MTIEAGEAVTESEKEKKEKKMKTDSAVRVSAAN